jgi:hypothetical protein
MQKLTSVNNDNAILLAEAQAELAAIEAGAGPGITADYGPKSIVTQLVETERAAAKSAAIDFIKANPQCTEADAVQAWEAAALASHSNFQYVLQSGMAMLELYRANMLAANIITDNTWEAQRAWVIATDKATILAA